MNFILRRRSFVSFWLALSLSVFCKALYAGSALPFIIEPAPNTILPTEVFLGKTVTAVYRVTNPTSQSANGISVVSLPPHTSIHPSGCGLRKTFNLPSGGSCNLTLTLSTAKLQSGDAINGANAPNVLMVCRDDKISCAGVSRKEWTLQTVVLPALSAPFQTIAQNRLINADLWDDKPRMMAAIYGAQGIGGVPGNKAAVIAAGGAWQIITTPDAPYGAYTSAKTVLNMVEGYGLALYHADLMPVTFSYPVLGATLDRTSFRVTLNTGDVVMPLGVTPQPMIYYNTRVTVALAGYFGNRLVGDMPGAVYPVKVEVVRNGTELLLMGPDGPVSAVGLSSDVDNPYAAGTEQLLGAKLSVMSAEGQYGPPGNNAQVPNDGVALYGADAQYRLRVLTSGGPSINGVSSIWPTQYEDFFKVAVVHNGTTTYLTKTGITYHFEPEGDIEVLGLANLGKFNEPLNDAYQSVGDNLVDIILKGDEAAMRLIKRVELPSVSPYLPIYTPGGPGNNPTPGVTYTRPSSSSVASVIMALDDPLTVNFP